jgi:hypothetical protein
MIIANPIYDVAFKRLLENNRVAKFLVGTILDCKIITLEHIVQEHTNFDDAGRLTLYRMDFAATIETKDEGVKRVIIELQKAKNLSDVYRFREYLGGEYTKSKFPIIAIYILGFNLSVDAPAFVAYPEYEDLRTREKLKIHDHFVEHLTHKAYFVQAKRIKQNISTRLDTLLSIFGQENFISADKTVKDFPAEVDCPEMKEILNILHYVAVDAEARKELDKEIYYQNYVENMFGEKDRELAETKEKLEVTGKKLEEADKAREESDKAREESDRELQKHKKEQAEFLRKMAKELKLAGVSLEKISKSTGMTAEEIEGL